MEQQGGIGSLRNRSKFGEIVVKVAHGTVAVRINSRAIFDFIGIPSTTDRQTADGADRDDACHISIRISKSTRALRLTGGFQKWMAKSFITRAAGSHRRDRHTDTQTAHARQRRRVDRQHTLERDISQFAVNLVINHVSALAGMGS